MKYTLMLSLLVIAALSSQSHANKENMVKSGRRAITLWWVIFNKPSECITDPTASVKCGVDDIMTNAAAGTNTPQIAIMHGTGGVANKWGYIRLTASLYKTKTCDLDLEGAPFTDQYVWGGPDALYTGTSYGYCGVDEEPEVHVVIRDHGPVVKKDRIAQITRFTDPSCSSVGGSNLCSDIGAVGFAASSIDGSWKSDIGNFPSFPAGCAEAGTCTKEVEEIQLSEGTGNKVEMIRTGDACQVVATLKIPKIRT